MRKQFYDMLEKLVIKNNIHVNQEELKLQLLSHPSYPSLHALTGVLDHFGITNLALRVPVNKETLVELPSCFIANVVREQEQSSLVLVEKKAAMFKISYDKKEIETISEEAFLEIWNGIILAIEKDENVKEQATNSWSNTARWSIYFLGVSLLLFLMYSTAGIFAGIHFLLSIVGLVLSVFIVQHELGLQSTAANNFCNLSARTSCDAVLNSKGATLFGLFKLSDVSIVVFASYVLYWILFFVAEKANLTLVFLTTALAVPFILYSVYYQYQVVKKWCPLCLGIVSVLALQAVALVFSEFSIALILIDMQGLLLAFLSVLVVIAAWDWIKPLLEKKKELEELEIKHYKFKRNFSLFNTLYKENDLLPNMIAISGEIVLGNKNAPLEILLVTSPLCHYCKQAHKDVERLLNSHYDQVKLVIRFNSNASNKEGVAYKITSRLLQLYATKEEAAFREILNEVYAENIDLSQWLKKETITTKDSYHQVLTQQEDWCKSNNINFTPAIYINGRQFPVEYDRSDLAFFIEDLMEQNQIDNLVLGQ